MLKIIKKLFKKSANYTVYKHAKTYKFKTFEKAVAFMMFG